MLDECIEVDRHLGLLFLHPWAADYHILWLRCIYCHRAIGIALDAEHVRHPIQWPIRYLIADLASYDCQDHIAHKK